jgi:hypothetical protein
LIAAIECKFYKVLSVYARGCFSPNLCRVDQGLFDKPVKRVRFKQAFTTVLLDWRTLSPQSRKKVIALRNEYEGHVKAVLDELSSTGLIPADTGMFRLFLLGALNWTVQWYRPGGDLTIDELADRFLELMVPSAGYNSGRLPAKVRNGGRQAAKRRKAARAI